MAIHRRWILFSENESVAISAGICVSATTRTAKEQARAGGRYRGHPQRKIQFYKNIGLVMRNSRWVSVLAGKNLKRAEEAAASFSARTLGPAASHALGPYRWEKNQPPRILSTPCSPSFSFHSVGRGLAFGSSFPPRRGHVFSRIFRRNVEFCEANKRGVFSLSFDRANDRDQYASIRRLLNSSISCYSPHCVKSEFKMVFYLSRTLRSHEISAWNYCCNSLWIFQKIYLFSDRSWLNDVWCIAFTQSTRDLQL